MNQLTNIYKILSDESRLRMIMLLNQDELCVCQLSGILGIPQPRVSQNLSKLRDLNIVKDERKEKFIFYTLRRDNKILMDTLQNIMNDLESYPQLVLDKSKLPDKESHLNQCCSAAN